MGISMTQEEKDLALLTEIPTITNDKLKLFVDNKFIGELDVNQFNQYRVNIIEHISQTGDTSILQRIYFVGHETYDDNTIGEEIKIEFEDPYGNLTDFPYELDRVRMYLYKLMKLGKKILEYNL
jgi:hypothetical protein